jgi:hypothetical protein
VHFLVPLGLWPSIARAIPVKLDPVAVRIGEVERLADAVVGSSLQRYPSLDQATQRVGESQ